MLQQPVFTLNGVTNIPTFEQIQAALPQSNVIRAIADDLKVPVTYQGAFVVEREIVPRTTAAFSYIVSRTDNFIRLRNINAPICPEQINCNDAPLPFPNSGPIYQYESTGTLNQNRFNFNFRSNFSQQYSVFGNYSLGFSNGDSDGSGFAGSGEGAGGSRVGGGGVSAGV